MMEQLAGMGAYAQGMLAVVVLYFVVGLVLLLPAAWRSPDPRVSRSRLTWAALGVLMVLYLVWAEFFGVSAICLWCTSVHVITLLMFIVTLFAEVGGPRSDDLEWLDDLDDEE